ncbi:hypothetical protein ACSZOC_21730, partial [Aeromonas hydrophila]
MNSLRRLWAITQKALRQLARDRLTFGMVVMNPAGGIDEQSATAGKIRYNARPFRPDHRGPMPTPLPWHQIDTVL